MYKRQSDCIDILPHTDLRVDLVFPRRRGLYDMIQDVSLFVITAYATIRFNGTLSDLFTASRSRNEWRCMMGEWERASYS